MASKFEVYTKLAKHARDDRDFDLAAKLLEKALSEKPEDYDAAMDLLKARLESTNAPHISVVLKDVERAFLADPSQIDTYKFILPLLYQNKLPEFDVWIERAIVSFPDEVSFLNFAGVNAMKTDTKKARSYFSQCVSHDPMNAEHHYNSGLTYLAFPDGFVLEARLDRGETRSRRRIRQTFKVQGVFDDFVWG